MGEALVKSNRDYEEHLEKVLEVQRLKALGTSDVLVCKELGIGASTLQKYKQTLTKINLESLTAEYQNAKRHEIDDQVQASIYKLSSAMSCVEAEYAEQKAKAEQQMDEADVPVETKLKLARYTRYPVESILDVQKVLLNAIKIRSEVWGLNQDVATADSPKNGKNVTFTQINKYEAPSERLHAMADAVVGKIDGVQVQKD